MSSWQKIGDCAVDSGQIILIDPCYIVGDEGESPLTNYEEILAGWEFDKKPRKHFFPFHLGVIIESGWGDGYYPVYAKFTDGRLTQVMIDFDEEMEDE